MAISLGIYPIFRHTHMEKQNSCSSHHQPVHDCQASGRHVANPCKCCKYFYPVPLRLNTTKRTPGGMPCIYSFWVPFHYRKDGISKALPVVLSKNVFIKQCFNVFDLIKDQTREVVCMISKNYLNLKLIIKVMQRIRL